MKNLEPLENLFAGVNVYEPGHGLFYVIRNLDFDPLNDNIVKINQSSKAFDRNDASYLINWNDTTGWASNGELGGYFELEFPSFFIEMTGYSFRSVNYDDNVPRTWSVKCVDNGRMIHDVPFNDTLCNGIKGYLNNCNINDEKAFYTTKSFPCQKFRFILTGKESSDTYYFVLSGIELFGRILFRKKYQRTCSHKYPVFKQSITAIHILILK